MQSLLFKKGQKYPSLEYRQPQDNKMSQQYPGLRYSSHLSLPGMPFPYSCLLPVVLPLEIILGEINNTLMDLPHQIVFLVEHRIHKHFRTPICLQSFPSSTQLPFPNLFSFHSCILASHPLSRNCFLQNATTVSPSHLTQEAGNQPRSLCLLQSWVRDVIHHLNVSALSCSNLSSLKSNPEILFRQGVDYKPSRRPDLSA